MFDWIWHNKEWVFSGAGIAAIGLVVWIVKCGHSRIKVGRSKSAPQAEQLTGIAQYSKQVTQQNQLAAVTAAPTSKSLSPLESLTPNSILAAVSAAPFLQRPDVAKHYVGIQVEWEGQLFSVEADGGEYRLILSVGSKSVVCWIESGAYSGFGLLKDGDAIRVSGVIENVFEYRIELTGARLLNVTRRNAATK